MNTILDKVSSTMKQVITMYQSACSLGDLLLHKQAEALLNKIISQISVIMPMQLGNGILGIACGAIYLHYHHYVEGDIDDSLSEIDRQILIKLDNYLKGSYLPWADWLYYLRLRILCERSPKRRLSELRIHQGIILLFDHLVEEYRSGYILSDSEIEEIRALHSMGICPLRTGDLLRDYEKVCFIIPVRIDSKERERNLDFVVEQLSRIKNGEICIIEGDSRQHYMLKRTYPNVYYRFIKDTDPVFYRTRYLNDAIRQVRSLIVGIWDTDVYVSDCQIQEAIEAIKTNKTVFSIPYNDRTVMLSPESTNRFIMEKTETTLLYEYLVTHSCGGAFFVNRSVYVQAGGENEHFYGWGPEDLERVKRMEILGYSVTRIKGDLYHLYHPRGKNSRYASEKLEIRNREEFLNICKMEVVELREYISTWGDRSSMNQFIEGYRLEEKRKAETDFWKQEISQYLIWYDNKISYLYNTPAPLSEQKIIIKDNPIYSAILTWTELHQQPKYLHDLQLHSSIFTGKKVLDIGAGPIPSGICFEGCELYAVDPLMSDYCKLGFPHHLYPQVRFIEAYAERLPFDDHFFEVIISVNAIDHVDDLVKVSKELQRVAKSDCLFAIHTHYHEATVCEPIEINDEIFGDLFNWVKGLRIANKTKCSFSSKVGEDEWYVLWSNIKK